MFLVVGEKTIYNAINWNLWMLFREIRGKERR